MRNLDFLPMAQDFIALMLKGQIKNFTQRGKCSGCGECCSNILPLAQSEIKIITSYVKEHNIHPHCHSKHHEVIDAICPFLDNHKRCSIYEVRPLICKAFKCNLKAPSEKYIKIFLLEARTCLDVRDTFFHEDVSNGCVL